MSASFVQICPEVPVNGVCPVAMEWVVNKASSITLAEFVELLPWMGTLAVFCYGTNLMVRKLQFAR